MPYRITFSNPSPEAVTDSIRKYSKQVLGPSRSTVSCVTVDVIGYPVIVTRFLYLAT